MMCFIISSLPPASLVQTKDKMGGTCNMQELMIRKERHRQLCINGNIKMNVEQGGRVWAGFVWVRMEISGRPLLT
jgi:hypothetical protein